MLLYEQQNHLSDDYIKQKISEFLAEDIPSFDLTSKPLISETKFINAYLQAEEDLIFAGEKILPHFFSSISQVELKFQDGDFIKSGEVIALIKATAYDLLTKERVMLNLIQRLCGIATFTNKYALLAKPFGVKILDTRKTTPGLRLFEKFAVTAGGGFNHRLDLSSGVLIKDNHIKAAGSIKNAVQMIKLQNYNVPVELEVENFDEIREGLDSNVDGFLLDNMKPDIVKKAVEMIRLANPEKRFFIEASGGINLTNLEGYLDTGVDAISTGALTHSVKSSNIHLEFEK